MVVPLDIRLAGEVGVCNDGNTADLDGLGGLGRVALVYLIEQRNHPVSHDELAEAIWDNRLPRTWKSALRGVVSRVRSLFAQIGLDPDQLIVTGPNSYRVVLPPAARIDLEVAAHSVDLARAALERSDPGAALRELDQALTTTEQPLLPGADGIWVAQRHDQWRELRLTVLYLHAAALRETGDTAAAAAAAERLILLDPIRESSYVCLMDIHVAAGNRALALRTFDRCREVLVEQLGIDPSPLTHDAYRNVLGEPDPAAEPHSARQHRGLPSVLGRTQHRAPLLVGRITAMDRLSTAWAEATNGTSSVVVFSGDSGMGKTRLAAEFAASVADQGIVLYGGCDDDGVVPYQPFVEALRVEVEDCTLEDLRDRVPIGIPELARLFPGVARVVGPTAWDADDSSGDRFRLFEALTALLTSAAERAPVLLIVDDLQWADRPTVLLLRHLLRRLDTGRFLIALLTRSPGDLADALGDVPLPGEADRIMLEALDLASVEHLSTQFLGEAASEVAGRVLTETDGSPFLVTELLRHLAAVGFDDVDSMASILADDFPIVGKIGVPERVAAVLERQLRQLAPQTRSVLELAALAGEVFDLRIIEQAAGRLKPAVLDAVELAVSIGLVQQRDDAVGQFGFAHSLVRQVLTDEVVAVRRARSHLQIAQAIHELYGDESIEVRRDLLRHHRAALTPLSDLAEVVRYSLSVAEDAHSKLAFEDAVDHLESTISTMMTLSIDDPGASQRLKLALGRAYDLCGDRASARSAYSQAFEAARRTGELSSMAEAALGIGGPWTPTGRVDHEQMAALELVVASLGDHGNDRLRAVLLARLARAGRYAPGFDQRRRQLATEALAAARRAGDSTSLTAALMSQRVVVHGPDQIRQRLEALNDLVEMNRASGNLTRTLEVAPWHIMALFEAGEHRLADEALQSYGALADNAQRPFHRWCSEYLRATADTRTGRLDEAEKHIERAREIGVEAQVTDALTVYYGQLMMLRRDQRQCSELEELARRLNDRSRSRPFDGVLAWALAHSDRVDEAIALVPSHRTTRRDPQWLASAALWAETATIAGLGDLAATLFEELTPYAGTDIVVGPGVAWLGPMDHYLGVLAGCLGDLDTAHTYLGRAIDSTGHLGERCPSMLRSERARAQLG